MNFFYSAKRWQLTKLMLKRHMRYCTVYYFRHMLKFWFFYDRNTNRLRENIIASKVVITIIFIILLVSSFIPSRFACYYYFIPSSEVIRDLIIFVDNSRENQISLCPIVNLKLENRVDVENSYFTWQELEKKYSEIQVGGVSTPNHCNPRFRVAIIVPYRDREEQLKIFINHMHSFLQNQLLNYTIFIVEQTFKQPFNRAKLFNIGFVESRKLFDYQCFIFHDVDLLPENQNNIYACSKQPRHLSVSIDVFRYNLPYLYLFGGAIAMTREQFELVNGFSNKYFGWGGEDDDMANRILWNGMSIIRWSSEISKYKMLTHKKESPSENRFILLDRDENSFREDGLSSLKYTLLKLEKKSLYTWIYTEVSDV